MCCWCVVYLVLWLGLSKCYSIVCLDIQNNLIAQVCVCVTNFKYSLRAIHNLSCLPSTFKLYSWVYRDLCSYMVKYIHK